MTLLEEQEMPVFIKCPSCYVLLRNAILERWHDDCSREYTEAQVMCLYAYLHNVHARARLQTFVRSARARTPTHIHAYTYAHIVASCAGMWWQSLGSSFYSL